MLILFLGTFCGLGCSLTSIDNIGQIGESLGYPINTVSTFVSLISIWNYFGRVFAGFASEIILGKIQDPEAVYHVDGAIGIGNRKSLHLDPDFAVIIWRTEKAREIREQRRVDLAKQALNRFNLDPDYRFLHDRISDLFAGCLKSDVESLNSGQMKMIGFAAKWYPSQSDVGSIRSQVTFSLLNFVLVTFYLIVEVRLGFMASTWIREARFLDFLAEFFWNAFKVFDRMSQPDFLRIDLLIFLAEF